MTNIILCGGSGTRLWPLSRTLLPKQFVKMINGRSLFSLALKRCYDENAKNIIVCNENHYFLALDECEHTASLLQKEMDNSFILEPFGRNTAAAIAFGALSVDRDEILFISASDHIIANEEAFKVALNKAKALANEGKLVTFGINPNEPNTGYGYICAGAEINEGCYEVKSFVEKPDLATARQFLSSGGYYFNSGMFCFKAGALIDGLKEHAPNVLESAQKALENAKKDGKLSRINPSDMDKIADISIDYALMQKSSQIAMVGLDAGWSDLGSFDELSKHIPSSHYFSSNSADCFVKSSRNVALVGTKDLIVIDTADALLIANKGHSQDVKEIYKQISKQNPELTQIHTKAYRPWGSYEVLAEGAGYKLKRIIVKPGGRLSLQKHTYRSEHWIIVSGEAVVQNGDESLNLYANQSTYIPAGAVHRLHNQGKENLELIEVQVGSYLGEDDIVRIEDDYKRG